ncbi:unnamed protein product [Ambrosiozyma monospora]|uniref:Unnamed protein product n=1 Tax=Ambrosiozyma monospora TaxID=43982 RepID=A0ACB5SYE4_AMBMO|nr:unnamed protein product [Ambrosiozyma monospora]
MGMAIDIWPMGSLFIFLVKMIRNIPKNSLNVSKSLKSCMTYNNVFIRPVPLNNNNNNKYNNNRGKRNFTSQGKQFDAANSSVRIPDLKDITSHVSKSSLPYYRQLLAFDECVAHNSSFDLATGKVPGGTEQFWESIHRVMPLYNELIITGELTTKRMDELVSLLRNGLRVHRLELSKLKKNVDKDYNNPLIQMNDYLQRSLLTISDDIINCKVRLSSRGLTNLFKAYKDMGLSDQAAELWDKGKDNPDLYGEFTAESVLGSVFSFLVDNREFDFEEIWSIYSKIKASKGPNERIHSELQISMIRACLIKGQVEEGLAIFKELTTEVLAEYSSKNLEPPVAIKSYMTMAHLSFIGYCVDVETADVFFEGALKEDMPYYTPLQINYVKKYMQNTWSITKDFQKTQTIWEKTWKYYEKKGRSTSSISSSLNDTFLDIFFAKYPTFNAEAAQSLKSILASYNSIKNMDEPFFNCLLSKSAVWENAEVFKSIIKYSELYNFPKTNVFYRCALKSSGSVDLPIAETYQLFNDLLNSNISMEG